MATWEETRLFIERTLEDIKEWHKEHNLKLDQMTAKLASLEAELLLLKQKSALIGFLSGLVAASIATYVVAHIK